jgi:hypothetical protein
MLENPRVIGLLEYWHVGTADRLARPAQVAQSRALQIIAHFLFNNLAMNSSALFSAILGCTPKQCYEYTKQS